MNFQLKLIQFHWGKLIWTKWVSANAELFSWSHVKFYIPTQVTSEIVKYRNLWGMGLKSRDPWRRIVISVHVTDLTLKTRSVTQKYEKMSSFDLSALLQLHLHSQLNTWLQWIGQRQLQDETRNTYVWRWLGASYIRELTVYFILQ